MVVLRFSYGYKHLILFLFLFFFSLYLPFLSIRRSFRKILRRILSDGNEIFSFHMEDRYIYIYIQEIYNIANNRFVTLFDMNYITPTFVVLLSLHVAHIHKMVNYL